MEISAVKSCEISVQVKASSKIERWKLLKNDDTITKEPAVKAPPRPRSTSQWSKKTREKDAKKKAEKQANYEMVAQSGNNISQASQDTIIPSQSSVCRASTIS
ncbi:hypothetical protein RND81_11G226500 [Saponaria officinalis]|uniref:Uncharacterized protein n=1 Tax=Saponaria officinalis TaxID=3572 RepID=A0AAW1HQI2_SAPOF